MTPAELRDLPIVIHEPRSPRRRRPAGAPWPSWLLNVRRTSPATLCCCRLAACLRGMAGLTAWNSRDVTSAEGPCACFLGLRVSL